jgi:TetR/AcrR family transcriptional regulator, transcriptional repressor for nem operon
MSGQTTADRILDVAQGLMQTMGYPAFSYNDIAAELGVTKPAVHYHFGSKTDLGLAVTRRYRAAFASALSDIDQVEPALAKRLQRYAGLFATTLASGKICLCGLLAADDRNVPDQIRLEVAAFFDDQTTWLERTLRGVGHSQAVAVRRAAALLAGLEGALIISAAKQNEAMFAVTARELVRAATAKN